MRGITGWGTHLPYARLDRSAIKAVAGTGGGTGTRTVASYDEDTTTMGAEAARVEMTFRRLATSDGIHNYFWKARLVRGRAPDRAREG